MATTAFLLTFSTVQTTVAGWVTSYLNNTYKVNINIGTVYFKNLKTIGLGHIYVADHHNDTLLYAQTLNVSVETLVLPQNKLFVKKVQVENPKVYLKTYKNETDLNLHIFLQNFATNSDSASSTSFFIHALFFKIKNGAFKYINQNFIRNNQVVDYNHLYISNLDLTVTQAFVSPTTVDGYINKLLFTEQSGFQLQNLSGLVNVLPDKISLSGLDLQTPVSSVKGNIEFIHGNWSNYAQFLTDIQLNSIFQPSKINISDLAYFASGGLPKVHLPVLFEGDINGTVANLKSKNFSFSTGKNSHADLSMAVEGLPDVFNTKLNLHINSAATNLTDISYFSDVFAGAPFYVDILKDLGTLKYKGSINGKISDFLSDGIIQTNAGTLQIDGRLTFDSLNNVGFDGFLITEKLPIQKLVKINPTIADVSLNAKVKGTFLANGNYNVLLSAQSNHLVLNNYTLKNIEVNGKLSSGSFTGSMVVNDKNADFNFNGAANFGAKIPEYKFSANLKNINLAAFNLADSQVVKPFSGMVNINLKGSNLDNILGSGTIKNLVYGKNNDTLMVRHINLVAVQDDTTKSIGLMSDLGQIFISGNYHLSDIEPTISQFLYQIDPNYFQKPTINSKLPQEFTFKATIIRTQELAEAFIPDLKVKNTPVIIDGRFSKQNQKVNLNTTLPAFTYQNYQLSNSTLNAVLDESLINISYQNDEIKLSDSLKFENVTFNTKSVNNLVQFSTSWNSPTGIQSSGNIAGFAKILSATSFDINFFDTYLKVENTEWKLNDNNHILINGKNIAINDFEIKFNNQMFALKGSISENPEDELTVAFTNFDLSNLNALIPSDKIALTGVIHGSATAGNIYNNVVFTSNISLNNVEINQQNIGTGNLSAQWRKELEKITLNGSILGNNNNLIEIKGDYFPYNTQNSLAVNLKFTEFQVQLLQPFLVDFITNLKGSAGGNIAIRGSFNKPLLKGNLNLKSTSVKVPYLNAAFVIQNENFIIEEDWMGFNHIAIKDENGQIAYATGTINHENFDNLNFDVYLQTKNFFMLNTNSLQNPMFYGQAYVTGNVGMSGYTDQLDLDINVKTEKGTKLFVPLSGANEVSQNSFIKYLNPDADKNKDEYQVDLTGIKMKFLFHVTDQAELQLIFDETVGDVIKAKGNGDIQMDINTLGQFNMYGDYIVTEGDYLFTLKNIINKRFNVRQGSSISWNGDPYNAKLDLVAFYKTRSSIEDLGLPIDSTAARRKIPVEVDLKMSNNLVSPDISFDIKLPTLDENTQSMVSNTINTTEEELNKQVFSLLLMNRFAPPESGLQAGGAVSASSSELLANQLTNWLSKSSISNYVEIGFNELTTDEVEVALSKRLFNDRVVVEGNFGNTGQTQQVNTEGNGNLVGNFNVEYFIRKDGKLRARAYRKSNDFNMVNANYSQYTEGIGLFWQEDFDTWGEFFKKLFTKEVETDQP